jgi:hypothetical protein
VVVLVRVVVVLIVRLVARFEIALRWGWVFRRWNDAALKEHVHEEIHRLRLHHERTRRPVGIAVEVLMNAVVVHDRGVAGFPLVANPVVLFCALAV